MVHVRKKSEDYEHPAADTNSVQFGDAGRNVLSGKPLDEYVRIKCFSPPN